MNNRLWIASIISLGVVLCGVTAIAQTPASPANAPSVASQSHVAKATGLIQQCRQAISQRNIPLAVTSFKQAAGYLPVAPQLRTELDSLYGQLKGLGVAAKDLMSVVPPVLGTAGEVALQAPNQTIPDGFKLPSMQMLLGSDATTEMNLRRLPSAGATAPGPNAVAAVPGEPNPPENARRTLQQSLAEANRLVAIGRAALDRGDVRTAQQLASQAYAMQIPDDAFQPGQQRPWQLMLDADAAMRRQPQRNPNTPPGGVVQAGAVVPAGNAPVMGGVQLGGYNPSLDKSQVVQAQATAPLAPNRGSTAGLPPAPKPKDPNETYRKGVEALSAGDSVGARKLFVEAWKDQAILDPQIRQQLKDKLTLMQPATAPRPSGQPEAFDAVTQEQALARASLMREVTSELAIVEKDKKSDPRGALERLQRLRRSVAGNSSADSASRQQMLSMVDRQIAAQNKYVDRNRAQIELDAENDRIRGEINQEQIDTLELDAKISQLVEQFNDLMEDQRYPEAEIIAKQVNELKPNSPIGVSLRHMSSMGIQIAQAESIKQRKEGGFLNALEAVDESSIAFDDRNPDSIRFGD